jgi:hypothetical protein
VTSEPEPAPAPAPAPRTWSRWLGAWIGALLLGLALAPILAAPDVPATCETILDLAARAGEAVGAAEREACEAHYARLRARRGPLGWAWLSWCTRWAQSIPEAGEC